VAPANSAGNPIWIRTAKGRLEVTADIAMLIYTLMMAWNVAKILNPPLQVREDLLIARIKILVKGLRSDVEDLPDLTVSQAAELHNDLRKFGELCRSWAVTVRAWVLHSWSVLVSLPN
jgi:hypothetical protein